MPSLNYASKALGCLVSRRNLFRESVINSSNSNRIRSLSSIAGINALSSAYNIVGSGYRIYDFSNFRNFSNACCLFIQKRRFLGCGDGEEGNMLSKLYEERRVLGYSPEQLYDIVAAVDLYEDFLPWCRRSQIIRRNPDGTFDAELEIGFKFFIESYISHVELNKPKSIKTISSQSSLFDHLINIWEFNPGPVPGSCNIHFLVDFKFQSPLYHQMANMFFKEVASRVVGSFSDRCRLIYGPGVVLEKIYQ